MSDIDIRIEGRAGRITLTRPQALNALSYDMCMAIDAALIAWRDDPAVDLVMFDALGPRAFCAGGDIAEMYATGLRGDYDYGRKFWRDEYRMNAQIFEFPKPTVAFLHGFVMGGGVGVGCHAGLRIVGESSQVSMPECGIGLIPDVGGTMLLAHAPGRMGEYLGTTGTRMGPADAILAGFADVFLPEVEWDAAKSAMMESGRAELTGATPPPGKLAPLRESIDAHFAGETVSDIFRSLQGDDSEFARDTLKTLTRNAPFSMACTVEMLHRLGDTPDIRTALGLEYRYTHRAMEQSDFLEGVRAAIIDKDRNPRWRHADPDAVPGIEVSHILLPLG
ncbi:MAG: enoyl-CoA hydratase/isomerase family protein, partial [Gemmobacter sp.]|nr:enoyl-CoA hydratase/isomerase family protein [Gemmobacter sp.]